MDMDETTSKPVDFAAWLRGRRAQLAQNQEVAAGKIGVSRDWLARWEAGKRLPTTIAHCEQIAAWAGVDAEDVLRRVRTAQSTTAA